jgi:hypothetical protein
MEISTTTVIVGILFVALYVTLLIWRRAESRRVEELTVTLLLPPNADIERVNELEEQLAQAVEQAGAGRLHGDQFRAEGCSIYLQGRSAERLLQAILPALKEFGPSPGSYVVKRYGAPGAREERVEL